MEEFREHACGAVGDCGRFDGWGAQEAGGVQAREDPIGGAEEDGKAEGEEVGRVA